MLIINLVFISGESIGQNFIRFGLVRFIGSVGFRNSFGFVYEKERLVIVANVFTGSTLMDSLI